MKLKAGMLGTLDHIRLFAPEAARHEEVEFVGLTEPDEERGERLAKEYGTARVDSVDSLLDQNLDMVGVFTPFHERADIIARCLDLGLHVFTDKPAATNGAGLEMLRKRMAEKPELKFTMGLVLRVQPPYAKLAQLVRAGAVGRPLVVTARRAYRLRRDTRPPFMFDSGLSGGEWVELAVHDIDYIRWLTGAEYRTVTATHGNGVNPNEPFQDHGAGLFTMDNGITALVDHNRMVPSVGGGSDNRLGVAGTEGVLDFGPGGKLTLWNKDQPSSPVTDLPEEASMFDNFVDAIRDGEPLIVPTEDVLRATEVVLAAYASAEKGGETVRL
jgi:myo-inositol 2-dehydrogenase/D-chiro-inositol 1-dehydrogenase